MTMWRPTELGEVIAERELAQRRPNARPKKLLLRIGRPVHAARPKGDPWWCPVEITGLGRSRHFVAAAGEDSLQALTCSFLAVEEYVQRYNSRHRTERVEWLYVSEHPIFAHANFIDIYDRAMKNLLAGIRYALFVIENPDLDRDHMRKQLNHLLENAGFGTPASEPRRRKR